MVEIILAAEHTLCVNILVVYLLSYVPNDFFLFALRFRNESNGFACGGSGSLFFTEDGGKSWKRDKSADQIPANLYAIKFSNSEQGFVLGNNGILLRYIG